MKGRKQEWWKSRYEIETKRGDLDGWQSDNQDNGKQPSIPSFTDSPVLTVKIKENFMQRLTSLLIIYL